MKIVNQKPSKIQPVYQDAIKKDLDVKLLIEQCISDPIFTPLLPTAPVQMTNNGSNFTKDNLTEMVIKACFGPAIDPVNEQAIRSLFKQTLIDYNDATNMNMTEAFMVQAGTKEKMDEPSDKAVYTPTMDVIPAAHDFLAGTCSYEKFFASLGYYARPETLGFYFANEIAFNNFIQWLTAQTNTISQMLPAQTNKLLSDFTQLKLNQLTESIILRNDTSDNNEPMSFARTLISMLMQYTNTANPSEFGVLPFNAKELFIPQTVVFVNVEKHSRATAQQIAAEWEMIRKSIAQKQIKMISNSKIQKLTTAQRNLQHIAAAAAYATSNMAATKSGNFTFSAERPNTIDVTKLIRKIMGKMEFTNKSMNVYRSVKSSFAKPNRRNPDNYNLQGKVVSTRYKPDIHLYIDTSGSISEKDYEDAVKACIAMAKKLNINMYFNSFSHVMSPTTKLHLEGKSRAAIFKEFQNVPKVSGGTNYEQIWTFISTSKKRARELSIIITDFEWTARPAFVPHPKNLYYIPCSTFSWNDIKQNATNFGKSMLHNEPNIRKHILF